MVGNDEFGKIIEPGSANAIENGIKQMAGDDQYLKQKSENIRKEYLNWFRREVTGGI